MEKELKEKIDYIMDYLRIDDETEFKDSFIKKALEVEDKYKEQIENGDYGYALICDFENNPFILEDEDIYNLEKVEQFQEGIVVYKKIEIYN
jgi:hypothetical protein